MLSLFLVLVDTDLFIKAAVFQSGIPNLRNYGLAFGLGEGTFFSSWIFHLGITLTALFYLSQKSRRHGRISFFSLVFLAGAFANLVTKIWLGYVIDIVFLNLADVYLVIGIAGIVYEESTRFKDRSSHLGG